MVEYSPKILASEEKTTTTVTMNSVTVVCAFYVQVDTVISSNGMNKVHGILNHVY